MAMLTVSARGRATLPRDVLRHLGVESGGKIELDMQAGGLIVLRAARPTGKIEDFFGSLAGKTDKVATIDDISKAAAAGWAGLIK